MLSCTLATPDLKQVLVPISPFLHLPAESKMAGIVDELILAKQQDRDILKARVRDLDVEIRLLIDQQRSTTRTKFRAEFQSSKLVATVAKSEKAKVESVPCATPPNEVIVKAKDQQGKVRRQVQGGGDLPGMAIAWLVFTALLGSLEAPSIILPGVRTPRHMRVIM